MVGHNKYTRYRPYHIIISCFYAYPREGHTKQDLQVFGYFKQCNNRRNVVDSYEPETQSDGSEIIAVREGFDTPF